MTLTRDDANRWLTRYGEAWEQGEPHMAAELFSENCRYFETPFAAPFEGRDAVAHYWRNVPEAQAGVRFEHRVIAIVERTVVAHWRAEFTRRDSQTHVDLDGMFLLEFDVRGLCETLREWWHIDETPPR